MKEINGDIRRQNKIRILKYILEEKCTSRQQIISELGYSRPTILQNIKELLDEGLLCEIGEFGSTGGRKAKMLAINPGVGCAVGVEVRLQEVRCALLDLNDSLTAFDSMTLPYENTHEYYESLGEYVKSFIANAGAGQRVVGVCISLPGVVNLERSVLEMSYGLNVSNISLNCFAQNIPYNVCFERDATGAARAEIQNGIEDTVYLFLDYTVGGAIYIRNHFFNGDFYKAGGFGHSIIVAGGRQCTCGKRGCFSAYCATEALLDGPGDSLKAFFSRLESGDEKSVQVWEEYVDKLAIGITNLRADFDCRIVLGGAVSEYLPSYLHQIKAKMQQYNTFDLDMSYVSVGRYHKKAASVGAAKKMIRKYIENLDMDI